MAASCQMHVCMLHEKITLLCEARHDMLLLNMEQTPGAGDCWDAQCKVNDGWKVSGCTSVDWNCLSCG